MFVGSHNFTRSALQNNHEISVLIDSRDISEQTAVYIEKLMGESKRKSAWDFFSDLFR
jgi:phosphatidylserine/phosphatidylglycerophosphate/cardiolipin synthase-like enzyme